MTTGNVSDFVFEVLVKLIQDSIQSGNIAVVTLTIDVLEEICKKNFQAMSRYYDVIYRLVFQAY